MQFRNNSSAPGSCGLERPLTRDLMDRLVLPGALGFTRFGYQVRKRSWSAVPEFQEERVAVVTGATSGLGRVVAERLAALGARVILVGRSREKLDSAVGEIARSTGSATLETEVADLSLKAEVRDLANRLLRRGEAIHILVNNAGITRDNLLMRMKPEEWNEVITTNLSGVYRLCKGCLRGMMKAKKGRIINIASVIGVMGNAGQSNYAAAKAGVIGFSKSLAREIGSRNITVNVVAPGFIDTDMTRVLPEDQRAAMLSQVPLGRLGESEDIANAVLFLASQAAAYVTGETLHVNGGMLMD